MQTTIRTAARIGTSDVPKEPRFSQQTKDLYRRYHTLSNIRQPTPAQTVDIVATSHALRLSVAENIRHNRLRKLEKLIKENAGLRNFARSGPLTPIITQLQRNDGTLATTKHDVIDVARGFYNELFAAIRPPQPFIPTAPRDAPPILTSEVEQAVRSLRSRRAPGPDRISSEMVKYGIDMLAQPLTTIFNEWLTQETVPDEVPDSIVKLIFKKGSALQIQNYRPIALLSVVYKTFTKVLERRMEKTLDANLSREQAGFRKSFSTTEHILTVEEMIQRSREYPMPLYLAFVDYEKGFDSVEFSSVWNALDCHGVPQPIVNTIRSIYRKAVVKLRITGEDVEINVRRGVRQGDTISPKLFAACLDKLFARSIGTTVELTSMEYAFLT
jgi:hypothetical protein